MVITGIQHWMRIREQLKNNSALTPLTVSGLGSQASSTCITHNDYTQWIIKCIVWVSELRFYTVFKIISLIPRRSSGTNTVNYINSMACYMYICFQQYFSNKSTGHHWKGLQVRLTKKLIWTRNFRLQVPPSMLRKSFQYIMYYQCSNELETSM